MIDAPKEYDGIYFLPHDENDHNLQLAFFTFKDDMSGGKPIESTSVGDKFHVAFFKRNEFGQPEFDGSFEAIFADPSVYIQNLVGANVYGCILRKTEKSQEWFDDYLTKTQKKIKIKSMVEQLKSIAES